jgi:hypothetical protein
MTGVGDQFAVEVSAQPLLGGLVAKRLERTAKKVPHFDAHRFIIAAVMVRG